MTTKSKPIEVDRFYFDANPLLHYAAQVVGNYGQQYNVLNPYGALSLEQKYEKMYEIFFAGMMKVLGMINPKKSLYIAIDGPAPLAKQAQQRQRRFVAARSRKTGAFDSNSISPGSLFMLGCTRYLHTAIRREANDPKSQWSKFPITFSPATVPGEGEHKILNHIRAEIALDPSYAKDSHCIYGPDGDLIILALCTHLEKIYLFREDLMSMGGYDLLDMGMVRNELTAALGLSKAVATKQRTIDDSSNDFTLIGFFVGNDFLPKIRMFMYLRDGLEHMLRVYAEQVRAANPVFLTEGYKINQSGFATFIETIAKDEIRYLFEQHTITYQDPKFRNVTLEENIITTGSLKRLDFKGYRKAYYAKAGIDDVSSENSDVTPLVEAMCLDYLGMMAWVYEYYVKGIPSWERYYRYSYAPLLTDLAKVMRSLSSKKFLKATSFIKDSPPLPFVQLLCILPPESAELLPRPFRKLMLDPDSPIADTYPKEFAIDYEGQAKEHMGVVLLPFADVSQVKKYYQPIADSLHNTYVRNSVGRPEKFFYDPSYNATYTSKYGNIDELHVRKVYV
jgi:5'-3' exoribonuclease 1